MRVVLSTFYDPEGQFLPENLPDFNAQSDIYFFENENGIKTAKVIFWLLKKMMEKGWLLLLVIELYFVKI